MRGWIPRAGRAHSPRRDPRALAPSRRRLHSPCNQNNAAACELDTTQSSRAPSYRFVDQVEPICLEITRFAASAVAKLPTGSRKQVFGMQRIRAFRRVAVSCLLAGVCAASALSQGQDQPKKQNEDQPQVQNENAKNAPAQTPGATQNTQQEEITAVPNRPTFASTAETVQRGAFEVEYGFELAKAHQNINGLLKWGMFKNLELWFLNIPIERDAGVAGRGDSGAGFKYRMFSQSKIKPSTAILYVATLTTATAELGSGAVGHSVQLLLSKDFGKHHFDVNEGVQFVGRPGASGFDRNYFTAISYSHPIRGKWGWTGELAGFSWTNANNPASMILLGAGTYNVSSRLVLDGGAYLAVYGNLPRVTLFSGVTYSVADLYHRHPSHRVAKH